MGEGTGFCKKRGGWNHKTVVGTVLGKVARGGHAAGGFKL